MKISKSTQEMIKSYVRAFAVAAVALYSTGVRDWKMLGIAGLAAVVGPAIRAIDKKDPAFGLVANLVDAELNKLAKADAKKSKK
jgi:hypothetical protein